jgi:competence protein ComEA
VDPLPPSWPTISSDLVPDPSGREVAPGAGARRAPLLAVVIGLAGIAIVAVAALAPDRSADGGAVTLPGAGSSAATGSDAAIVVEVIGAVRRPGLVHLPPGSRVADAIAAAGGYSAAVDAAAAARSLRLAAPVADGDQVLVPARGTTDEAGGTSAATQPGGPIDVNTASEQELDSLPGIGPVTVAKIVAARTERPFASVDELVERKVVGQATLAKIRDLIVVR